MAVARRQGNLPRGKSVCILSVLADSTISWRAFQRPNQRRPVKCSPERLDVNFSPVCVCGLSLSQLPPLLPSLIPHICVFVYLCICVFVYLRVCVFGNFSPMCVCGLSLSQPSHSLLFSNHHTSHLCIYLFVFCKWFSKKYVLLLKIGRVYRCPRIYM